MFYMLMRDGFKQRSASDILPTYVPCQLSRPMDLKTTRKYLILFRVALTVEKTTLDKRLWTHTANLSGMWVIRSEV